jgi:iron complex transport system ATP-binding protein
MNFLLAEDLKVGYQQRVVVGGINIALNKGEILCLLGPNGCGKSTILKTITDHIKRVGGSISVLGKEINRLSNKERAREMSVVLTDKIAPEMMTSEEIVATGRYPYTNYFGKLNDKDQKIIDESIEIVGGQKLRYKEFKSLSDGEKQRIMIARAICQESDIMVLDEPTSFLDIRFKVDLLNILRKLSLIKEKTIIMSLHEIDLATKIADKVLLIRDGKIYKYGAPEDIITDETIREVYNLNSGSFNTTMGNVELPKVIKGPKVFVIGGGGKSTKIYRALNKKGIGFYSGILFKNDIDYNVSESLACKTVAEDGFVDIKPEKLDEAKEYMGYCHAVIDSGVSLEGINKSNRELLRFASQRGIKILSLRNESMGLNLIKCHSISSMICKLVDFLETGAR